MIPVFCLKGTERHRGAILVHVYWHWIDSQDSQTELKITHNHEKSLAVGECANIASTIRHDENAQIRASPFPFALRRSSLIHFSVLQSSHSFPAFSILCPQTHVQTLPQPSPPRCPSRTRQFHMSPNSSPACSLSAPGQLQRGSQEVQSSRNASVRQGRFVMRLVGGASNAG